jgi:hypothetical protein
MTRLAKNKRTGFSRGSVWDKRNRRDNMLRKKYGIDIETYERMLRAQDGVCAICRRPPKTVRLNVDHDHKTGRVRGLLCFRCNKFQVGRHTLETAKAVYDYLNRPVAVGLEDNH